MTVRFTNRARKDIRRLTPENKERARRAVAALAGDPLRGVPLKGAWEGYRRFRFGDYRIIYRLCDDVLVVHYVRSRGHAYQDR